MKFSNFSFLLLGRLAFAVRPVNTTICDYYSLSILGANTASNQKLLMTLLINTVVLGNYTTPNTGIPVHGFATPAVYNGTKVALLPYFTPELESTNDGGSVGVSKAFLDDGGAVPLQKNMSSNGNTTSVQYNLLNNIYEYFGTLLNCSLQGSAEFPKYQGRTSMFEVHKFMDLSSFEMDFFIQQLIDSATSLGFAPSDTKAFYLSLQQFNSRCSPASAVPGLPQKSPVLNSVCLNKDCKLDATPNCGLYPLSVKPINATEAALNGTTASGSGKGNGSATTSAGIPVQSANEGAKGRVGEAFWTVAVVALAVAYVKMN